MNKHYNHQLQQNINLIDKVILTDKSTKLLENNQYCFQVDPKLSKTEIKRTIEYIFKVKVIQVNTIKTHPKKCKFGRFHGFRKQYKKAIIKISNESKIDLFSED